MNIPDFYVEPANYAADFDELRYLRTLVFVEEQQIAADIEFDDLDRQCHHVIARDGQGRAIGTGRLSPAGQLGRMAVLAEWRRQGVGASVLRALLEKARTVGLVNVVAHSQVDALGFYQKFGFSPEGAVFLAAGIAHQQVRLILQPLEMLSRPLPKPKAPTLEAVRLDTLELMLEASEQLISGARRQLAIYSRDLEYKLYGHKATVEALKQLALRNRNSCVQLIIQEPTNLSGQLHPVIELAQRLPSHFLIRAPLETEDLQYLPAFIANDSDGYLFRPLGDRSEGHWSPNLPSRNRQLRDEFERVWQRCRPCSEFRTLAL